LERVYPPEHAPLQAQVAEAGLVLSELAPGDRVQRSSFALRNRLLVALSRAVVVVECPVDSGALISAREALTQGRPLWAMPGDVLRSSARGSNQLLQQGAHPLLDVTAWVHALGPCPLPAVSCQHEQRLDSAPHAAHGQQRLAELDPALVALLEDGASLPRLASQLGRSSSQLAEQLVQLELEGVLTAEPGMRWRLA
jgi:DNA processing protein